MPDIYICRKCGRKHIKEEYNDNRFCRNCGTFLFRRREDLVATRPRRGGPTHADMIADVISELSEPFTTKQILDAVIDKYSSIRSIDRNSLSTDIAGCCVNYGSHDSLPELPFLLVALRRGLYRRYDPEKDGNVQPVVEGQAQIPRISMRPISGPQNLFLDVERARKIGATLHNLFKTRTGFFAGYTMPEYVLPENQEEGSLEHALYLTYVISIDYQTDAVRLWQNAREMYSRTQEYFNPKNLSAMPLEDLSVVLKSLGARYPNDAASAWKRISEILLEKYGGDPREITPEPLTVFQVKELVKGFPNLRGRKLSNFYLRTMGEKGLFKVKNLNELDIPVDVQVGRFTIYTGCLQLMKGFLGGCIQEPPIQPEIEGIWREAAKTLGIAPWELDEPIWTIGSKLCSSKHCSPCPVQELCAKNFDATIQGNSVYWKK